MPAEQKGTAFVRCARTDLDWVFSLQHERTVERDNTITLDNQVFQISKTKWRNTLAGCTVTVHEHLDGRIRVRYGPHGVGSFDSLAAGEPGRARAKPGANPLGNRRRAA